MRHINKKSGELLRVTPQMRCAKAAARTQLELATGRSSPTTTTTTTTTGMRLVLLVAIGISHIAIKPPNTVV